ncbi:MAG: hypothetical protein Fur0010_16210 [Bdellovibrio sp.]
MHEKPSIYRQFLYRGDYQSILKSRDALSDLTATIGALSFSGRPDEALMLFQKNNEKLPLDEIIENHFYLALGMIRNSRYREGRDILKSNILLSRRTKSPKDLFFIYQGLAFYRYFSGRWSSGLDSANKASLYALEAQFDFGLMLAEDVKGHLLVQLENVDRGLFFLYEAKKWAALIGNNSVILAVEISILTYEAQFALGQGDIINRLKGVLNQSDINDTYSRSTLMLEIARQLTLRGQLDQVADYLNKASVSIYLYKNRRQEAVLNLRWSEYNFRKGEFYQALSYVQSAERCLHPEVDFALILATLGMQLKIAIELKLKGKVEELKNKLKIQGQHYSGNIHRRMLHRIDPQFFPENPDSRGDRLAQLIDRNDIKEIIDSGYYSLLCSKLSRTPKDQVINLDLIKGKHFTYSSGQIYEVKKLTPLLKKLLETLCQNKVSKEDIVQTVWGQKYDPLRHDSLLYSNILKLRRSLSPHPDWIETIENGYCLANQVEVKGHLNVQSRKKREYQSDQIELNFRQLEFLNSLKTRIFINVQEYQKIFHISQITACRDLAIMCQKGYLLKIGKARATRYTLPEGVI